MVLILLAIMNLFMCFVPRLKGIANSRRTILEIAFFFGKICIILMLFIDSTKSLVIFVVKFVGFQ